MKRSGFTLLELILATAVAAMMSLAIYSAMASAFKTRNTAQAQMADIQSLTIAMDLIAADFQSIVVPGGTFSLSLTGYAMGTPGQESDSIDFYCLGRDRGAEGPFSEGFRRVQFTLKTDGEPMLVRRVTRNLLATALPEPQEEVLARDIIGFSMRYYDGYSWRSEWDSVLQQDTLPFAIEVTLRKRAVRDTTSGQSYSMTRIIALPCAALPEAEATNAQ